MMPSYMLTLRFPIKKIATLIGFFFLLFGTLQAQDSAPTVFPQVIGPSPTAASLGKYGEIPVSTYTGIPNIDIPLHTVQSGKLTLPISLSYHAGGIKIEDIASNVGLGWSLSAGGTITRTVRGMPDETQGVGYFANFPADPSLLTFDQLHNSASDVSDLQPDLFYFNFGNYSGKFLFDREGNCHSIPHQNFKIKPGIGPKSEGNERWEITAADGTIFIFNNKEQTTTESYSFSGSGISDNSSRIRTFVSSWCITTIQSAGNRHTIDFSYRTENIEYDVQASETRSYGGGAISKGFSKSSTASLFLSTITFAEGSVVINANISSSLPFPEPREDLTGSSRIREIQLLNANKQVVKKFILTHSYFSAGCADPKCKRLRLDAITEQGSGLAQNPSYRMEYNSEPLPARDSYDQDHWGYYNKSNNSQLVPQHVDYTVTPVLILKGADRRPNPNAAQAGTLKRIFYPTGGSTKFDYELNEVISELLPPKVLSTPTLNIIGNNTKPNNTSEIFTIKSYAHSGQVVKVRYQITGCTATGGDSETGGTINAPTFPTNCAQISIERLDGTPFTHFPYYPLENEETAEIYIPNGSYRLVGKNAIGSQTYLLEIKVENESSSLNKYAGGLRIARVTNYDAIDPSKDAIKEYIYNDDNGLSTGRLNGFPIYTYEDKLSYEKDSRCFSDNTRLNRTSNSNATLGNDQTSFVGYGKVTELHGSLGSNGKTEYYYTSIYATSNGGESYTDNIQATFPFGPGSLVNGWKAGNLLHRIDYQYVIADGQRFLPIKETTHSYQTMGAATLIDGIKVGISHHNSCQFGKDEIIFNQFATRVGCWYAPVKTIERIFDPAGNVMETSQEFSYDNDNLQLKEQKTILAPNWTLTTKYTYPNNYTASGTTPNAMGTALRAMNSKHIHNEVVEKQVWQEKNGKIGLIEGKINLFKPNGLDKDTQLQLLSKEPPPTYIPATIDQEGKFIFTSSQFDAAIQFDRYDTKGNLLDASKKGTRKAYLWGYGNTLPIAEASQATSEQMAYTSFENPNEGNWLYSAIESVTEDETITGSKYATGTITTAILLPAGKYLVSFWARGTGVVTLQGESIAITAGWILYQKPVVLTTSGKVILNAANNQIDELRLAPIGAMMSTYVYKPFVGLIAQADVTNRITYYEYDEMNRLKRELDADGNIIKDYRYHLTGKKSSSPSDENSLDASFQFTTSALTGQTLTFTAVAAAANLTYWWDLGAGRKLELGTKSQQTIYTLPGTYIVKLIVRNGNMYKTSSQLVTIKLPPPPEPAGWTAPAMSIVSVTKSVKFVDMKLVTMIHVSATATGNAGTLPYQLYEWKATKAGNSQALATMTTTTDQTTLNFGAALFQFWEEKKYEIKCRIKDSQNVYSEWQNVVINEPN